MRTARNLPNRGGCSTDQDVVPSCKRLSVALLGLVENVLMCPSTVVYGCSAIDFRKITNTLDT